MDAPRRWRPARSRGAGWPSPATRSTGPRADPTEGGRQVVVGSRDRSPAATISRRREVSVRSRVHEYGGARRRSTGSTSSTSTRPTSAGTGVALGRRGTPGRPHTRRRHSAQPPLRGRTADPERAVAGQRRGAHPDGATAHRWWRWRPTAPQRVDVLDERSDFVAAPRPSPDGSRLAWIAWDHPSMPWDSPSCGSR